MSAKTTFPGLFAKGPDSGSDASRAREAASKRRPRISIADPDSAVDRILALLSEGRFSAARRVAAEARKTFPDHSRVQNAWSIFDRRGKATVGEATSEPSREAELEWLSRPPESVRGKWVALQGRELVDSAETLKELQESLAAKDLPRASAGSLR